MPFSKAHASLGLPRLFVFRLWQEHDVAEEVSGFETRACSGLVNIAQLMFSCPSIYTWCGRGERGGGAGRQQWEVFMHSQSSSSPKWVVPATCQEPKAVVYVNVWFLCRWLHRMKHQIKERLDLLTEVLTPRLFCCKTLLLSSMQTENQRPIYCIHIKSFD